MAQSRGQVLVVEDDPEVNQLVGAYAQIAGFGYEAALNGFTALSKAAADTPVLILLDVMLPDVDGFEVCRRLKCDDLTRSIPIVMLTALDREEYRRRGQECGAAAFLGKPFDPDCLIEMIRKMASSIAAVQPSET
jgi:putative two-component system response regulator